MKITLFGMPGAGKSTFAHNLGGTLGLPVHHLDCYFFDANWQEVDPELFLKNLKGLVAQQHWIIDGNCLSTIEHRLAAADVIIYFRFSFWPCLYRVIKRRLFGNPFQDKRDDCPLVLTWNLIKFMWTFKARRDENALALLEKYKHKRVYVVRNATEVSGLFDLLPTLGDLFHLFV